jgi:hypothetical protein
MDVWGGVHGRDVCLLDVHLNSIRFYYRSRGFRKLPAPARNPLFFGTA